MPFEAPIIAIAALVSVLVVALCSAVFLLARERDRPRCTPGPDGPKPERALPMSGGKLGTTSPS